MKTNNEVAQIFAFVSWDQLLTQVRTGVIVTVSSKQIGAVGKEWDQMRVQHDLVQVRAGLSWRIGARSSFTEQELAPDLEFAGLLAAYDDSTKPVACQRADAVLKASSQDAQRRLAEMQSINRQANVLIGVLGGIVMVCALFLAGYLPAYGFITFPVFLAGLWLVLVAWIKAGDQWKGENGHEPSWSFRTHFLASVIPKALWERL